MADSKITALASIGTGTDPANDPLVIVDVSDILPGGMSLTGTTKKVTLNNLLACSPTATLASATITGDLTVDTNTLKVDSANNRVGIGTASPARPLDIVGSFQSTLGWVLTGTPAGLGGATRYIGGASTTDSWYYNAVTGGSHLWAFGESLAMTLNATGLGVGVASPSYKLDVAGTAMRIRSASAYSALIVSSQDSNAATRNWAVASTFNNYGDLCFVQSNAQNGDPLTAGTVRFQIDSSGNVGIGVTPSAGKGCLQLSSGINFPATQVASSDANTLDDYEEGTWTGTLKGSVSDPTIPVTATGAYTKVGRLVTVTIRYINVLTTGASGDVTITGLPFAGAENSAGSSIAFSMFTTSTTLACWNNSTSIAFYVSGTFTPATHSAGSNRSVAVTITYYV